MKLATRVAPFISAKRAAFHSFVAKIAITLDAARRELDIAALPAIAPA